jgi:hypothetical protein
MTRTDRTDRTDRTERTRGEEGRRERENGEDGDRKHTLALKKGRGLAISGTTCILRMSST